MKMKMYHTETQRDFDALMIKLEREKMTWPDGVKPTDEKLSHCWRANGSATCIRVEGGTITYDDIVYRTQVEPGIIIEKYKANDINNDGVYVQVDKKVVFIEDVPTTGFGQTVINWADGKPVSAETTTKHKIKY
ncbi:hypothetical protein EP56_05690 [Listeriaceae bacterium FSL A5-0209]|nr:hypothetical protein EP56_05690 [Listeriaceae bacterium FSL A5-0209]